MIAPAPVTASPALMPPSQALLRGFESPAVPAPAVVAGAALSSPAAESGVRRRQGFRIGSLRLMMRYEDGNELADMPPLSSLPNAPRWLSGMANLHGSLVPVFDLSTYFQVPWAAGAAPMLLVLGHGADVAGVVVDGLPRRLRWTEDQLADPGTIPEALLPVVHCAVMIDDELCLDLNVPALLDTLENALRVQH